MENEWLNGYWFAVRLSLLFQRRTALSINMVPSFVAAPATSSSHWSHNSICVSSGRDRAGLVNCIGLPISVMLCMYLACPSVWYDSLLLSPGLCSAGVWSPGRSRSTLLRYEQLPATWAPWSGGCYTGGRVKHFTFTVQINTVECNNTEVTRICTHFVPDL